MSISNTDYEKMIDYIMSLYNKDELQIEIEIWDAFCDDILGYDKANLHYDCCLDISDYTEAFS
jgi:hypothetical protein